MLFNSWEFVIFLLFVFVVYYIFEKFAVVKLQVSFLLLSSFVFYAHNKPILLVLLVFSLFVNSLFTIQILKRESGRKGLIFGGVIFNVCLLAIFKYNKLICTTFGIGLPSADFAGSWFYNLPLPIGISFFTFQSISLLVDVHKGKLDFKKRDDVWGNIWFYIAFFPQLIAGPIVKAGDFFPQIALKKFKNIDWSLAVRMIILGYFFKMYVADNLKETTAVISNDNAYHLFSALDLSLLMYGYSFQIYADFLGYSSIAIGLGALFGYKLPINFNFPYIAKSITEFWRRWHISLSSWLREYLYIPLGGNRKGRIRTYVNLMIVMILGGLWHGAEIKYAIWGLAHGVFLALERFIFNGKVEERTSGGALKEYFYMLLTFHLATFLWLFFIIEDRQILKFFGSFFDNFFIFHIKARLLFSVFIFGMPVIIHHLYALYESKRSKVGAFSLFSHKKEYTVVNDLGFAMMLFLLIFNSGAKGEFIYFQF